MDHHHPQAATMQTYPSGDYWSTQSVRSAIAASPARSRASTWDSVFSLDALPRPSGLHPHLDEPTKEVKGNVLAIETPKDWCRGQAAEVIWTTVDPAFNAAVLRIEVCNKAWDVPTTIAEHAPNTGCFEWKRVHWGMPIQGDYFIKVYAVSELGVLELVAQSPLFAIVQ
ncbi:hypothetical protein ACHHYP_07753 [Achlya hypogyna]|uniref:Uncharacterized protein n=1 Tax=Achlya hypogyna TaxID=1202772 RepID=A0A1V9ZLI9_ACHHY|nr:hypothetical protein ACHHYP_07753 [Achlya hypogyna]